MKTQQDRQAVEAFVVDAIDSLTDEEVSPDATLEDVKIDSLALVEVGQMVEEEYGVRLTADDLREIATVSDAVDLVASRL
jgi:acyl carrier protein